MQNEALHKQAKEERLQKAKKSKNIKKRKMFIYLMIIACIFIFTISFIIYWSITNKSVLGQISDLDEAIKNKDDNKVSEMLHVNGNEISQKEAKHIIDYLNTPNNKAKYNKEISNIKKNVKADKQTDTELGRITDNKNKPIITISRDGVKAFILKKVAFTPHYRNVYVKSLNNKASYHMKYGNKDLKAIENTKTTKLGRFIVGNYDVPATKTFDESETGTNDSVDGHIHINTDKINKDGRIYADDDFPQSWFKIQLKNSKKLDKHFKLYIDDNEIDYQKNKTYGKFPAGNPISIKATGRLNNATISTNEVEVKANETSQPQIVTLTFKDNQISKEIKNSEKVSKEAKDFLKSYTNQLNHSYERSDFDNLKSYFEDTNSDVAKNIKKQVESKKERHFSNIKFRSSKQNENEVTVIMSKKNDKKQNITSQYILKYDDVKHDFKIKSYTDI